jgi:hypothetical protein
MPEWVVNGESGAMESLFCSYRNTSDRMVIVRCCGPRDFFLERVVFPFELLTFHSPPESDVEVWRHGFQGCELAETMTAEELTMAEPTHLRRRDWLPPVAQRTVGVRDNASAVSMETL